MKNGWKLAFLLAVSAGVGTWMALDHRTWGRVEKVYRELSGSAHADESRPSKAWVSESANRTSWDHLVSLNPEQLEGIGAFPTVYAAGSDEPCNPCDPSREKELVVQKCHHSGGPAGNEVTEQKVGIFAQPGIDEAYDTVEKELFRDGCEGFPVDVLMAHHVPVSLAVVSGSAIEALSAWTVRRTAEISFLSTPMEALSSITSFCAALRKCEIPPVPASP